MGWEESVNDLQVLAERRNDEEMKQKVARVRIECAKLADELTAARRPPTMDWDGKVFWEVGNDGKRVGPICPECWQGKRNPVRMVEDSGDHQCPVCKRWANFRPLASYGEAPNVETLMDKEF